MAQTNMIDTDAVYGNVVEQLRAQHEQVRAAIYGVAETTTADSRQDAFDRLRDLLEKHEAAEESVVHPLTGSLEDGEAVAEARTEEENEAKQLLAELEELDIASVEFARTFETFAQAVLTHAQREEGEEFPLLQRRLDAAKLSTMEGQLLDAESTSTA